MRKTDGRRTDLIKRGWRQYAVNESELIAMSPVSRDGTGGKEMGDIVEAPETSVTTISRKKAAAIHGYEVSERIAERIKDASALEKALLGKLEAQRDLRRNIKRISQRRAKRQPICSQKQKRQSWRFCFKLLKTGVSRMDLLCVRYSVG